MWEVSAMRGKSAYDKALDKRFGSGFSDLLKKDAVCPKCYTIDAERNDCPKCGETIFVCVNANCGEWF